MNRTEYMRELDALLHGISKEEREEAMQYYNDYFDDAGSENEEKIIEELGGFVVRLYQYGYCICRQCK